MIQRPWDGTTCSLLFWRLFFDFLFLLFRRMLLIDCQLLSDDIKCRNVKGTGYVCGNSTDIFVLVLLHVVVFFRPNQSGGGLRVAFFFLSSLLLSFLFQSSSSYVVFFRTEVGGEGFLLALVLRVLREREKGR